jgi:hypothetical protein
MKEIPLEIDEQEEPPLPTIMELAMKEAFGRQGDDRDAKGRKTKGGKKAPRREQNDIIARTLRSHGG